MKYLVGQRMTMQVLFDPLRLVSFDPFRLGGGEGGGGQKLLSRKLPNVQSPCTVLKTGNRIIQTGQGINFPISLPWIERLP